MCSTYINVGKSFSDAGLMLRGRKTKKIGFAHSAKVRTHCAACVSCLPFDTVFLFLKLSHKIWAHCGHHFHTSPSSIHPGSI